MADEHTPPPPAAAAAAPATPSLPATTALPGDQPAAATAAPAAAEPSQPDPEAERAARGADWDNYFKEGTPTPKVDPPRGVPDAAPEPPVVTAKPAAPAAEKSAEPAAVIPPKLPGDPAKPPATPDTDELPEDLFDGIPKDYPKNHVDAVKRADKMAKRLRLAGDKIKGLKEQIAKGPQPAAGAAPNPEQVQAVETVKKLEKQLLDREQELTQVRDRLYANELTARPEYIQHVSQPWEEVKQTVDSICKKYRQDPKDVWAAYRMEKPEERDAAFTEMLTVMNPQDQYKFNQAIERVPQITKAQQLLEAHSKERLDQYREQDKQRDQKARESTINLAVSAANAHYQERRAAMPFLYEVEGDTPEIKEYNQGMKEVLDLAEKLTRQGVDKMRPELQGKMVHDAVTADYIVRNIAGVLRAKDQQNQDQAGKIKELEAAMATLQSEVDAYRGAAPNEHGLPPVAGVPSANGVPSLEENTGRFAAGFGWQTRQ